MTSKITYTQMRTYAETNGFLTVWRSWRDNMLKQGRDVPEKRMTKETLPQDDIELDTEIAYDVVMDFVEWLNTQDIIGTPTVITQSVGNIEAGATVTGVSIGRLG